MYILYKFIFILVLSPKWTIRFPNVTRILHVVHGVLLLYKSHTKIIRVLKSFD